MLATLSEVFYWAMLGFLVFTIGVCCLCAAVVVGTCIISGGIFLCERLEDYLEQHKQDFIFSSKKD